MCWYKNTGGAGKPISVPFTCLAVLVTLAGHAGRILPPREY